jgi:hypothetical protein
MIITASEGFSAIFEMWMGGGGRGRMVRITKDEGLIRSETLGGTD